MSSFSFLYFLRKHTHTAVSIELWEAFSRMLSSCGLTAKPWLPLHRQWKESYVHDSVGAVCVHVRVCIHALTRVTAQLYSWLGPHRHLDCMYISIWTSSWQKTKLQAQEFKSAFFQKSIWSGWPWAFLGLYLELSVESKSGLSSGKTSTRKRGEPSASMSFASAYPCTLCVVHDSLSTTWLGWSSGNSGNLDILGQSLERCKTSN